MGIYMGLDASTQSVSSSVIDTSTGTIVAEGSVNFGADLPGYNCPAGFLPNDNPLIRHSDPLMWVAALQLLFERMQADGFDFSSVDAVSGSGQQHGSVYLKAPIASLDPDKSLSDNVRPLLSRQTSPIWMDASTGEECAEIADASGGGDRVRELSGSVPAERFTGPQIRRFFKFERDSYAETGRIHLVSSFMASVLCGGDAGIDSGDGAGMNLMNLASGDWDDLLLNATAPDLRRRLPAPAGNGATVGKVDNWFIDRFGFRPDVPVIAFSGDNPCSLVGMGASLPGTAVVSLGTSDTFFAAMPEPVTDPDGCGHAFGNPAGGYMSLICFKNGSLAREAVANKLELDWDQFANAILEKSAPGNEGNLMLPYFETEITPRVNHAGPVLSGSNAFAEWQDTAAAARAVVEAQALSMRLHSEWIASRPTEIRLTGGASRNPAIAQVIADVFGATIRRLTTANSAALGAAMMAAAGTGEDFAALGAAFSAPDPDFCVTPNADATAVYDEALPKLQALIAARQAEANG
jgi:xylulokinase